MIWLTTQYSPVRVRHCRPLLVSGYSALLLVHTPICDFWFYRLKLEGLCRGFPEVDIGRLDGSGDRVVCHRDGGWAFKRRLIRSGGGSR